MDCAAIIKNKINGFSAAPSATERQCMSIGALRNTEHTPPNIIIVKSIVVKEPIELRQRPVQQPRNI